MDRARRNFRHAQIRAEDSSRRIQSVGPNSYVSLFDEGYETIVLFDVNTSIHPAAYDIFLPGLNDARREFTKAYGEVLLRRCGDKIKFAFVDHFADEQNNTLPDTNLLSMLHYKAKLAKSIQSKTSSKKMGEIRVVSKSRGILGSIDINDITVFMNSLVSMALPSLIKDVFEDKIRYVDAIPKLSIICELGRIGVLLPSRNEVDFTKRDCPVTPPNP